MPEESSNVKITRSHHTTLPEVETLLSAHTYPKAVCHLYHDEFKQQRLQLDADDNGVVRFHVKAQKDWRPIELHLEYTGEDGIPVKHTFALWGDTEHSAPTSSNEVHAPPVGSLRPALEGDPLALSNEELMARGYPPRPDPKDAPARYARWHGIVSQPYTAVTPRLVPHPEVSFARPHQVPGSSSPTLPLPPPHRALALSAPTIPLPALLARPMFNANSNNWSGAYLDKPINQFCAVQADWRVPGVFHAPNYPHFYSAASEWIGMDNSLSDLYQSGTDSECYNLSSYNWTVTNYWMWIERLPAAACAVANFPIAPTDSVTAEIFVADDNGKAWYNEGTWGGLTSQDTSVWFMLYNHTRHLYYWGTLPVAAIGGNSTPFSGTTAEFILERPTYNGGPALLANFIATEMRNCWYGDAQYGDKRFPLGVDGSKPFDCDLAYWNMQNAITKNQLDFALSQPDPSSSTGTEIVWIWFHYI